MEREPYTQPCPLGTDPQRDERGGWGNVEGEIGTRLM
jgi:hypothetical protein